MMEDETVKLERFKVKDIIFIACIAAALTLGGMLTMPLVMSIDLFALRNMASAFLYSIFTILGIMKVKKMGTLTLVGLLHSFVLLMMAPVMFWSLFLAAFSSELIVWLIFHNYTTDRAKIMASTLFIPMSIPATLVFTMLIHGKTISEVIERPFLSLGICVCTVLLSFVGTKLGFKIGTELQKAGKLS